MHYPVNCNNLSPKTEFYEEVTTLYVTATNYLKSFHWCNQIKDAFLYTNIGRVFCIFLFDIDNLSSDEDNLLWIIVGDIPSMYLDTQGPQTTREVVEDYIRLSQNWIKNIKTGSSLEFCFPFRAEPTLELAGLLEKKIAFMKATLINDIDNLSLSAIN
ncbi:hypothetical protein [Mucilaginibacter paludis]|uniref:Uncharacterized protein n=1 Tax=Mucilaginibacter paludis DSM 18603 TaxID=714943 RepID=H1YGY4_9SPHI|nr:hypothetical protein [Mucilaginibacter paludis]EHQ27393.1 hypothetical protein Mucpa_3289 [Mucilaginibacter paludis DSM 18603]